MFAAMEEAGMPGASVHIADPNGPFWDRGKWAADPVEYWRQIMGLERVLQRHPDMVMVAAHGAWLVVQDAQIDFLRYLLSTYPNFYVDLAATFQYFHLVNHENLRDFIMEYSDRILYGTDIGRIKDESEIPEYVDRYSRTFRMLETDEMVEGGFFSMNPAKGLNLPKDVLEKIYYKNALGIYPGLKNKMNSLGYLATTD
jgi:predicted TIM-barrel fold metal-dependent hydrolase